MTSKWVDNTEYFGPDRRRRSAKRWGDRRHYDETVPLPPLGALLRRLRVQMVSLTPDQCAHALQMLNGAIGEANRQGLRRCAASLLAADAAIRQSGARGSAIADAHLVEAMDHAAGQR